MKLKNEGRKLRDGHKNSTSGFSTKAETKYKSGKGQVKLGGGGEGSWRKLWVSSEENTHTFRYPCPTQEKELLRGISRSNPMNSYLKKEIIMKQKVNIQGKERPLYQPGNPRLKCIAIK